MAESAGRCPVRVERAVMKHRWESLTFLHWAYDVDVVQRLLPPGLAVDPFDGAAWVGLIPFRMRVALGPVAGVPWVTQFWETNVRTYARDRAGNAGIWFFSLDASRLGAVVTARASYRLPYYWSRMRLRRSGDRVSYRCERRWPGPAGATSHVAVDVGPAYAEHELGALDHFLTARWRLFALGRGGSLAAVLAEHPPWPLRRATAVSVDDHLVAAAGLPAPAGDPLLHYSDGVAVRIGAPTRS